MPTSRIPSPARSQGATTTPRRYKTRGPRSVGSPARSDVSGRLTSMINMHKNNSFALSPMPSRRSVLADTTDVDEPKRRSWWRQLGENSRDVIEVIESNKVSTETNNIVEDLIEMEVLSQEKKSYNLDLPESSDNESIHSIIMPQRKLFKQKDNEPQNKFGQLVGNRETLPKLHKTNTGDDKTVNAVPRELFNTNKQRNKPIFPAALLEISLNKTAADKSKEKIKEPPKNEVRNIFGNRIATKRKNMFAEFVVSESEDEISEIQAKVFGFAKKSDQRSRTSTISRGKREPSPASSVTTDMELDDWRMLPSSTMVAEQLEEAVSATPVKRARLSKLSEAKESDAGTNSNATVNKTKQSNKSISSKNKSINLSSVKGKSLEMNRSMTTRSASKTIQDNSQNNITSKALNVSSNKSKNSNTSQNKHNSQKNKPVRVTNDKNDTLEKSKQNISKSKTINIAKHMQKAQEQNIGNLIEPDKISERGEIDNNHDNEENNFTLEYESDDHKEVTIQKENNSVKNKTVTLKRDSNLPQIKVPSTEEQNISFKQIQNISYKNTVDETEESQTLKENELASTKQDNQPEIDGRNISKHGSADKIISNQEQINVNNHELEKYDIQTAKNQNELGQNMFTEEQMEVDEVDEGPKKTIAKQNTFVNDKSMQIDLKIREDLDKSKETPELCNVSIPIDKINQNSQINRCQEQSNHSKYTIQKHNNSNEIEMQDQRVEHNENEKQECEDLENGENIEQLQNESQKSEADHGLEQEREINKDENLENENDDSRHETEHALNEITTLEHNESEDAQIQNESLAENLNDNEAIEQNERDAKKVNERKAEENNASRAEEENESEAEAEEQNESVVEEQNESEAEEQNESVVEEQNESEAEEQNESLVEEQNESIADVQKEIEAEEENESEEEEQNESEDEEQNESEDIHNESQEIQNEGQEEEQTETQEGNESQEVENESQEEQNESQEVQNESQVEQNESQEEQIESQEEQNESHEEQNESQEEQNESEVDGVSDIEEPNESQEVEVNESDTEEQEENHEDEIENEIVANEHNGSQEESEDVIEKTDTPNSSGVKSPEAILHDKTNQADSFTTQGRNTSVRKSKSMIRPLNIRPSMAPPRESTGLSDGARDSSAEGSGWDSHRTTRKTLRQTFGKDFTPRKSLRAMVMEKSAKRQTAYMDARSEITTLPQANSTEYPEMSNRDYDDDESMVPSDHEVSKRTRQATLEMCLQEIQKKNMERRQKTEMEVRNLFKPSAKENNPFKVPARPMFASRRVTKPVQNKSKAKQINSVIPLDDLPPEMLDDMKYKPPKRFQPSNASWITKRLYKFLETKLEPKYDYKARVRAEKLVETIYHFSKELRRHEVAPTDAVEVLKHEMTRLDIVKTHFEFYEFFNDYMPREIRVKVIPDIVNKIPMPKRGIFSEIQV